MGEVNTNKKNVQQTTTWNECAEVRTDVAGMHVKTTIYPEALCSEAMVAMSIFGNCSVIRESAGMPTTSQSSKMIVNSSRTSNEARFSSVLRITAIVSRMFRISCGIVADNYCILYSMATLQCRFRYFVGIQCRHAWCINATLMS